jgi:hypothetical protein
MKFEVLSLYLQHDVTRCYAAPDTSIPHVSACFFSVHLDIGFQSRPTSSYWSVSFTVLDQNFLNITPQHLVTRTTFCETRTNHETPHSNDNDISKLQPARRTAMGQLVGRSSDRCFDRRSWLWAGRRHRYSALVTVRTALTIFVPYSLLISDFALSSRISRALCNVVAEQSLDRP